MNKPTVEIIEEEKYISQIIDELRKEYGVKRKGDTYMDKKVKNGCEQHPSGGVSAV